MVLPPSTLPGHKPKTNAAQTIMHQKGLIILWIVAAFQLLVAKTHTRTFSPLVIRPLLSSLLLDAQNVNSESQLSTLKRILRSLATTADPPLLPFTRLLSSPSLSADLETGTDTESSSISPTAEPTTSPSTTSTLDTPQTATPSAAMADQPQNQPQQDQPVPTSIVIPDQRTDGDVSNTDSNFSFSSSYITVGLLLIGIVALFAFYRCIFGRRSASTTSNASYSPVPQQESGDIEMARGGGTSGQPVAADEWEDDEWDQPEPTTKSSSLTQNRSRDAMATSGESQHGRNISSSPVLKPSATASNNNNLSNTSSFGNLSGGSGSGVVRSASRQSSNPNSQHGSYNSLPEPMPSIAPPPSSASKRSNRVTPPVEEDLFASIGISAAPKINDPGLPDIDTIFSQRTVTSNSTRSNGSNQRGGSGKGSAKSTMVARKLGSDEIDAGGRWDDDKELDDLINS